MSKDKSKKWVISAPLFYNYAGILVLGDFRIPYYVIPQLDWGISVVRPQVEG
ncbi:MAG: hypothetical protein MR469_05510 [Campylobacter sp.]|uniref:hypothetical protein n=1 Tax=Campylobacter sp. TaxID=205 RepID=UPI002AA5E7B7|nr:hypothetical protein [Campylobacter sp.]MCI6695084.1 hypothetical protein [Campylobacter sp.]